MSYTYRFARPAVMADCVILSRAGGTVRVLLVKRRNPPFQGRWALPGGFVEMDESLEEAAHRELREETGVTGMRLKQLQAFGDPGRDPRGRVITVAFMGEVGKLRRRVRGRSDAKEARWFPASKVPPLGFDHRKIVKFALARLEGGCRR